MKTKFKSLALLAAIASTFLCIGKTAAQNIINYSFTASSGTYTGVNGTSPALTAGNTDDGYYNSLPIGFDFWYMGVRYTTFSASTNGWLTLGQAITNSAPGNDLTNGGNRPVIAPLWDNLKIYGGFLTLGAGNFSYATAGTAGSRILTVQWDLMEWNSGAGAGVVSFQAKLYEGSGKVEFVYSSTLAGTSSPSASVGITGAGTGSGTFQSLTGLGTLPSVSSTVETNNISAKPAFGQTFTATPTALTAPSNLTFTNVGATIMTLNWTDNSSGELGFAIYRSTDNTTFTYVTTTAANATSSAQTGLTTGTTYYWRVYAVRESLSSPLSGSAIPSCAGITISQIPSGSIVGIYKFDGNANDANGNANPGILQGSPTLTTDRFGVANKAYSFNGTSQYVTTTNTYSNPNNFTVAIWFKTTTTSGGRLIGLGKSQTGQSANYDRHIYMDNTGHIVFGVNPVPIKTLITTNSYNDGNWHQAVASLSSTSGTTLYVDGVLQGSDPTVVSAENYVGYWRMGYDNLTAWVPLPTSFYFNGALDDAVIYNRVLSPSEISTLYKSPDGAGNNGPVCVGATLTLSAASLPGATYSWTGPNSFSSALQNPTLSYSTAAAGVYSVTASLNGCTSTAYTIVTTTGIGQWTGNTDTGWAVAANWCSGTVPTGSVNATIPGSLTKYPVVSTTQPVNNISISSGASVTVTGGTLQIAGTINNSGTFTTSAGGIEMNGSSAQIIPSNVFASNLIKNLTINNTAGVTLNGKLRLTSLLSVNAGNFATNNFLTLASTASETANVAAIPASYSITGGVTVERFVTGGAQNPYRTYRMFSSPVYDNTTTFINANTPGNRTYKFSQYIDDIIVTGAGGATNGFDATPGNTASAFTYSSNYVAIPNINTTVNIGRGTYVFFRGDRSNFSGKTNSPFVNPENTTVTFAGTLNQQSITVPLDYGTASNGKVGFNLVGNPYAATIDWASANWTAGDKVNINNSVWIWNPATRSYATFKSGVGANGGSRYIGSGQAFFVQSTAASGSITFKESIKASSQQPSTLLMSAPIHGEVLAGGASLPATIFDQPSLLRMKLKKPGAFNEDETVVVFKSGASLAYNNEDATHFDGEGVFLSSLSSDKIALAINFMPPLDSASHVDLNVNASTNGSYTLSFSLADFAEGYTLNLRDSLLGTVTPIVSDTTYAFSIDKSVALSFGVDRFRLFVQPPTTLPLMMTHFSGNKVENGVHLKWHTQFEENGSHFDIERAGDDQMFTVIATIAAKGKGSYELLDPSPLPGYNYYRLKQMDKDGNWVFSDPISVKYELNSLTKTSIALFPNPVNDNFTIRYNGTLSGDKQLVKITSPAGESITAVTLSKDQLNSGYVVNASNFATGVYVVEVYDQQNGRKLGTIKMIKL